MSTTEHARLQTEQHPDLAAFEVKSRASEIETIARMTFESRLDSMGETVAVFDAKRRASRWSNQQARKYRKVAYLFGQIADYRTNEKQASWAWLARKYAKLHKGEAISDRALRRIAKEMAALGLIEIRANVQVEHDDCVCRHCEHPGASEQNTYAVHVGLRVNNKGQLAVHDFNAALPDADEKPAGSAECQQCRAAFDPKRPDARFCSARCRKAASKASVTEAGRGDVTHNDHPVGHRVDHPVDHPYLLEIPSQNTSSSSGDDSRPSALDEEEDLQADEAEYWLAEIGMTWKVFEREVLKLDDLASNVIPLLLDLKAGRIRGWATPGKITPPMIIAHLNDIYDAWKELTAEDAAAAENTARIEREQAAIDAESAALVDEYVALSEEYARLRGYDPLSAWIWKNGQALTSAEYAREKASSRDLVGIGHLIDGVRKGIAKIAATA